MKLCECGCGAPAPIAQRTSTRRGYVRGEPVRFIVGHSTPQMRERNAAAKRGVPRSAETRARLREAQTGRIDPPHVRAKKKAAALRGTASPVWVGEGAAYNTVHKRAGAVLPEECAHADSSCKGVLEVALRRDAPDDQVRTSPRGYRYFFGANVEEGYVRLCRSHHRRYDA